METSEFYFIYSVINKFLIFDIPVLRFYKKPVVPGFKPKRKVKSWIDSILLTCAATLLNYI